MGEASLRRPTIGGTDGSRRSTLPAAAERVSADAAGLTARSESDAVLNDTARASDDGARDMKSPANSTPWGRRRGGNRLGLRTHE
jgi:hypothetical protein